MMNNQSKKILVADDDQSILDVLKLMLEQVGGYEVETTTDGESVLRLNEEEYPDLILLDLWMSGIDGSEVCRSLKADEKTKHLPLIIFSANRDVKDISQKAGADDFIAKPFQMSDLLEKVERLTANKL